MKIQISLVFTLVLRCFGQQGSGISTGLQADRGAQSHLNAPSGLSGPRPDGADVPLEQLPEWLQRLDGSTISGNVLIGGFGGLPPHGGTGADGDYSSGIRDNWGADPRAPMPPSVSNWRMPTLGLQDRDFLRRISSDFLRGWGRINNNAVGPTSTLISDVSGTKTVDANAASLAGVGRPRVDSFVLSPDVQGIVQATGPSQVEGIVDIYGRPVLGSDNQVMSPFARGASPQQAGIGMPGRRATEFIDVGVMPGSSTGPVAGSFPPAGTGLRAFLGSGQVDIYGRRRVGSLRPKRSIAN